jgi:hypothetical protein
MTTTTTPEQNIDNLGLANVKEGKAPQYRITDPKKAQETGHKLVLDNEERTRQDALVKGMLDGNKPYSHARLRSAGQTWRTNVNFMEGEAAISAANTPFYDLFTGSKYLFDIYTKFGANVKERHDFGVGITEEADKFVKKWDEWEFNMQALINEMIAYGRGFLLWLDPTDWRPEWVQQHRVYAPNQAKALASKLPVLVIRGEYQVHELWRIIESPKAGDMGWNVSFAKRCIENAYPRDRDNTGNHDYMAIQQRMKDADIYEGMSAPVISVFHVLVAEFDGSVSYLIVPETSMPTNGASEKAVDFILERRKSYENFGQAIATFFFETLDGSWNGARGLGDKIRDQIELKNRLKCTTMDGAFIRAGISMQAASAGDLDKASLIQIGAFNIIPPGYTVQPSTIMGDLQGPMLADRLLDQTIASNTGIYKPRLDKPEGNPRTAEEVRLNFQSQATLSSSAVNRFYLRLDRYYTELVRRLKKDKEFIAACKERGIPKEALDKIDRVCAHRAVGNGSPFMRQQALREIGGVVPLMPESGRTEWAMDVVASNTDQYAASKYFASIESDLAQTRDAYDADVENNLIGLGGRAMWAMHQNNIIHAQSHIQFAASSLASLEQGANPVEVSNALDRVGPHIAEHLAHIQKDGYHDQELKVLTQQYEQIAQQADQLKKVIQQQAEQAQENAEKQAEAQAIQQGTDPDTQIQMAKAAADNQRKAEKHAQQMQQKAESHNIKMVTKDATTAATISQMKAKADAQMKAAAVGKATEDNT